jgi:hypothetical protein
VIINSIAATTTSTGLKVFARLDQRDDPQTIQVTDKQIAAVNLARDAFHPEWNYTISPTPQSAGNYLRLLIPYGETLSRVNAEMPAAVAGISCRSGATGWPGARRAVRLLCAGGRVGYRLRRTGFRRESQAV